MLRLINNLTKNILKGNDISFDDAIHISKITEQKDIVSLISLANIIRFEFKGLVIDTCAIINAKSGQCGEDCKFCSQSSHYHTDIEKYPLVEKETILEKAKDAININANRFGIVVSGRDANNINDLKTICNAIEDITSDLMISGCASLGVLTEETALTLKKAGLKRYHHNLETAESFFPNVCTTHSYKERVNTVKIAKKTGFEVCCGGIFGIGESQTQRVEFAFALKELNVDSIPLNFLNPYPGTPLDNADPIHPMDILKIIAIFRFIHPTKDIRICGGRQKNLRNTQALMYLAGANAVMIGDYLTVPGSDPVEDLQLIEDLMLIPRSKNISQ